MSEWDDIRNRPANLVLGRKLGIAAWIVTVVVLLLVGLMRRVTIPLPEGVDLGMLPGFHAMLNSVAAVLLVLALAAIKRKRIVWHRRFVNGALVCSCLFLVSYVVYHFTSGETLYGDANGDGNVDAGELAAAGGMRSVYLVLLLSHIVLAAVSFPGILFTWVFGFTAQFEKHRRLARWVFPVWLYVAVTGPVCYLMLRPFY